jgi:ribosomal protein S18 acetylase RimI-like enzyme
MVIRPTVPEDSETLIGLAAETGVFKPLEIQALREVLHDYFVANQALGHLSVTLEQNGEILGFAYYAPVAMTDRSRSLYWIAVKKHTQARGLGSKLLKYVEDDVKAKNGRMLLIDTSSLPNYGPTRKFYLKHQYEIGSEFPDFYADGDNLIVFRKRMDR